MRNKRKNAKDQNARVIKGLMGIISGFLGQSMPIIYTIFEPLTRRE